MPESLKTMARQPKFKYRNTPSGWMVNCPASLSETGKRERHFFKTRDKAKDHAEGLREKVKMHGENATTIRPSLAEAAVQAEAILEPWGLSLVEAARIAAAIRKRETESRPLDEATAAWLVACEGLRPRTVDGYRQVARRLDNAFAGRLLATITAEQLQAVVAPPGAVGAAVMGRIRNARAFWRWAASKGWCQAEVFDGVEAPKGNTDAEIEVLTPAEAKALLLIAEKHYPQAVASYALQLFAGIRAEELVRLEAHHVTSSGIDMPASVTKKNRRRHISPNDTLTVWLKRYPFTPCANWDEVNKACRRLTGWAVESRLLADPPKPTKGPWPQNALRHSHASYAIAAGVPLETLLFEFGHAGTPALLRSNYVGRVTKKAAIEFFSIVPKPADGRETEKIETIKIA